MPRPARRYARAMSTRPRSRTGRRVAFAAALALALVGAVVASEAVRITGDALQRPHIAAFYEQPADAASGAPGTLVKSDPLWGNPLAARGWRIMYTSTDVHGDPVVVTGVVVEPLTPPPPGGRTIVSWAHPTTGAAERCAPSRGFDPTSLIEGLHELLARGNVVVATDYAGMGTDGPDSYLVGPTEGANVLDAVRAAQALLGDRVNDGVILWGHSQGGQAALFAAERAAQYAPELDIRAVAVAAPAADLLDLVGAHLDDISGVTIGSYAFTAYAEVYDEPIDGILTPAAQQVAPRINEGCLLTEMSQLHALGAPLVGDFTSADPTTTEPWAGLLRENSAGATAFAAPLFVAQGLDDTLVIPADTADFVAHERELGIDVSFVEIPFADHGTIAYLAVPALLVWLADVGAW